MIKFLLILSAVGWVTAVIGWVTMGFLIRFIITKNGKIKTEQQLKNKDTIFKKEKIKNDYDKTKKTTENSTTLSDLDSIRNQLQDRHSNRD